MPVKDVGFNHEVRIDKIGVNFFRKCNLSKIAVKSPLRKKSKDMLFFLI